MDCNYCQIVDLLDPDHGLLKELLAARCISEEQKAHVESGSSSRERSSRMIECLRGKHDFCIVSVVDCLKRTKQQRLTSALMQSAGTIIILFNCHFHIMNVANVIVICYFDYRSNYH